MSDHKRHALQLACQLPDNASDARAIIREPQHLVETWIYAEPEPVPSRVFALVRDRE
jgi:hypothetical protein